MRKESPPEEKRRNEQIERDRGELRRDKTVFRAANVLGRFVYTNFEGNIIHALSHDTLGTVVILLAIGLPTRSDELKLP